MLEQARDSYVGHSVLESRCANRTGRATKLRRGRACDHHGKGCDSRGAGSCLDLRFDRRIHWRIRAARRARDVNLSVLLGIWRDRALISSTTRPALARVVVPQRLDDVLSLVIADLLGNLLLRIRVSTRAKTRFWQDVRTSFASGALLPVAISRTCVLESIGSARTSFASIVRCFWVERSVV